MGEKKILSEGTDQEVNQDKSNKNSDLSFIEMLKRLRKEGKFLPKYTGSDLTKKEAKEQTKEVKMLSDISNYFGLNFYKTVLVYSKVENNGELRNDELRAFLELGIPLLDELVRRYKIDHGQTLSKNEMFSMNFENPICFESIEQVFNDIHKEILIESTTKKKKELNKNKEPRPEVAIDKTYVRKLTGNWNEKETMIEGIARILGVDKDRLELIYSTVKESNFLSTLELRQLSEMGIPIVDKIHDKFNVTRNDVPYFVSNGAVQFKELEDIFNDMYLQLKSMDKKIKQNVELENIIIDLKSLIKNSLLNGKPSAKLFFLANKQSAVKEETREMSFHDLCKNERSKIERLIKLGVLGSDKTRSHNVGASDYSKHLIQPWAIWEDYKLDPFDADIIKRILRDKSGESKKLDYEKIIHICQEKIRQIG